MSAALAVRLAAVGAALVLAGCASGEAPGAAPPQAAETAEAPDAPARREVTFEWEGQFGRGVCVPLPTGGCMVDPLHEDTRLAETIEVEGRGVSATVALRWTPDTPATQNLWLGVAVQRGEETREVGHKAGPPPVVIEVDDLGMQPGDKLVLFVEDVGLDESSPVPFHAWTTQEFRVEGALAVEDAPPADDAQDPTGDHL